jgi:rhodanese-related sulfurtransferase
VEHISPAEAHARLGELTVLDVRDEAAFGAGHLAGAGNVPLAEFRPRRAELPPRETPVLVVADGADRGREAAGALEALGFTRVCWLAAPPGALEGGLASRGPAARLWRPAPFLEEVLALIPRGRAADLAAGSGREAVFLAMHGFEVEAWDASPEALERAAALAARHGTAIATVVCDLEAPEPPLPEARYQLVVCFRFLHRPLFPRIERALASGGYLVCETFRAGQERLGPPRRARFLLESGEFARAFPGLEILRHEEPHPPGGPLTARLVARKRIP